MRLAVLSRNPRLHSIRRLLEESSKLGIPLDLVNPLECQIVVEGKKSRLVVGDHVLPRYDAVLPRIGASITPYGLAVVKQFEALGMTTVNSAEAIAQSRDKFRALQMMNQAGIRVPVTVLSRSETGLRSIPKIVGGMPVILKLLKGTQGVGVMLLHTPASFESVVETIWQFNQDIVVQEYLREGRGHDLRVFVVGNRVIAAMQRTASKGEFRANIHRGGLGSFIKLPKAYENAAIRAAHVLGLEVAGVDLMRSRQGPVVLEVNSSPGFEGIEKATGLNVAGEIIRHMSRLANRRA